MSEAELVAAIAAAPSDDAPRLVFADWLMQHGDPRGELIALQCALARADATDTPLADEATAIARERQLRERHRDAWLAPLRAIVDAGYAWRRGFVERVALWRAADLFALDPLVEAAPLLHALAFSVCQPSTRLFATPAWSRLETLVLEELRDVPDLLAVDLIESPHAAALRRLQLTNCSVDTARVRELLALRQPLEHEFTAGLPDNRITPIKEYRRISGTGLADAKMAVERISEELGYPFIQRGAVTRWVHP